MKIDLHLSEKEYANIIMGVLIGTSFYSKFDRDVRDNKHFPALNKSNLEEIFGLLKNIRSHWRNSKEFKKFLKGSKNFRIFEKDYKKKEVYERFIRSIKIDDIQNTKISKFLHVLYPKFFPMLDSEQGKLLVRERYDNSSRVSLIEAIENFHKQFKTNLAKIKKIKKRLEGYDIKITEVRVFELLIWLQGKINNQKDRKNKKFKLNIEVIMN